jgi:lipopolysaccharide/colanic/teichoic acid biosynthesis glycosyltransferase
VSGTRIDVPWTMRGRLSYESFLKRLLDLLLASLGLLAICPVWLAIVIAVRLDSSGPAIFTQERVGQHGRAFRFYKFRSMYVDAGERLADVLAHNELDGPVFKIRDDPRVTRVGAFLRRGPTSQPGDIRAFRTAK